MSIIDKIDNYLVSESLYGLDWKYLKKFGRLRDVWIKEFVVDMTLPKFMKTFSKLAGYTVGYDLEKNDIEASIGNTGYLVILPDEIYLDLHKKNILDKIDDMFY